MNTFQSAATGSCRRGLLALGVLCALAPLLPCPVAFADVTPVRNSDGTTTTTYTGADLRDSGTGSSRADNSPQTSQAVTRDEDGKITRLQTRFEDRSTVTIDFDRRKTTTTITDRRGRVLKTTVQTKPDGDGNYTHATTTHGSDGGTTVQTNHYRRGDIFANRAEIEEFDLFKLPISREVKLLAETGDPGVTGGWKETYKDGKWVKTQTWDSKKGDWVKVPPTPGSPVSFRTGQDDIRFRAGFEVQLYAAGETGAGGRGEATQQLVTDTTFVTRQELRNVFDGIGFRPQLVDVQVPVQTQRTVTGFDQPSSLYDCGQAGGGFAANYFFTPNFGAGLEYDVLSGYTATHTVAANVIYRRPFACCGPVPNFALYAIAGLGGDFGDENCFRGHVGGGLEYRPSPRMGIFTDIRAVFRDGDCVGAGFRGGFTFPIGP